MARIVYIIDDEPEVRNSLRALLGTRGNLHLIPYGSGDQFIDDLDGQEPGVALLDIHLPGRSGMDVLKYLSDHKSPHAVVVLTGQGDIPMAVQALHLGAVDFLEKPYDHLSLFGAIDAAFDRVEKTAARDARVDKAAELFASLSDREKAVFDLLFAGGSNKSIARDLDITPRTVEFHRANMMKKLGVDSLPEAIRLMLLAQYTPVENTGAL